MPVCSPESKSSELYIKIQFDLLRKTKVGLVEKCVHFVYIFICYLTKNITLCWKTLIKVIGNSGCQRFKIYLNHRFLESHSAYEN